MANQYGQCGPILGQTGTGGNIETATVATNFGVDWEGLAGPLPIISDTTAIASRSAATGKISHVQSGAGILCRNMISGGIAAAAGKLVKLTFAVVRGVWTPQITAVASAATEKFVFPLDCKLPGGLARYDLAWVRTRGIARVLASDAGVTAQDVLTALGTDAGEASTKAAFSATATADEVFNNVGVTLETATDGQFMFMLICPQFFPY